MLCFRSLYYQKVAVLSKSETVHNLVRYSFAFGELSLDGRAVGYHGSSFDYFKVHLYAVPLLLHEHHLEGFPSIFKILCMDEPHPKFVKQNYQQKIQGRTHHNRCHIECLYFGEFILQKVQRMLGNENHKHHEQQIVTL